MKVNVSRQLGRAPGRSPALVTKERIHNRRCSDGHEERDGRVLLVCTFIRHNTRTAVGIIGTPGAIAMLKGIANYRYASCRREACP